ncbi:MAG: hypothetical protein WC989_03370 [Micavibrio sp.]
MAQTGNNYYKKQGFKKAQPQREATQTRAEGAENAESLGGFAEPTIWSLRKNARLEGDGWAIADTQGPQRGSARIPSLYEHLYGYDPAPIRPGGKPDAPPDSAENPGLNILAPATNFITVQIASDAASGPKSPAAPKPPLKMSRILDKSRSRSL